VVSAPDPLLGQLRARRRDGTVSMDIRQLRFLTPAHLVGIAAKAHRARHSELHFVLHGPDDDDVARYAARMRLGEILDSLQADHRLPSRRARDRRGHLLEIIQINSEAEVEALATLVYEKVNGTSPVRAEALHKSLGEIGMNVAEHAAAAGFLAAQTMPNLAELRLAVGDGGRGLLATLEPWSPTDDGEAIELALSNASRFARPGRGRGLPTTLDAIHGLRGSVYIATGNAAVHAVSPTKRRRREGSARFRGTLVEARIPLPH